MFWHFPGHFMPAMLCCKIKGRESVCIKAIKVYNLQIPAISLDEWWLSTQHVLHISRFLADSTKIGISRMLDWYHHQLFLRRGD